MDFVILRSVRQGTAWQPVGTVLHEPTVEELATSVNASIEGYGGQHAIARLIDVVEVDQPIPAATVASWLTQGVVAGAPDG